MTLSVLASAALRGVRSALLSALVLAFAAACTAQAPRATAQPASNAAVPGAVPGKAATTGHPAAASPAPAEPAPRGSHEGITVHGHWIIDVRNPDGSLVTHREFENSLVTTSGTANGSMFLTGVLGRTITTGSWEINLITSNNSIHIMEPNSTQSATCPSDIVTCSPTLTLVAGNPVNPGVLTFAGSAIVPTGQSSIVSVETDTIACPSTFLASACFNLNYLVASNGMVDYPFTSTTLTPAITITPGQVVQAQVNISFQ